MLSRASCSSGAIGLHLGRDAVERLLQAQVVADAVGAALGDERLDVLVRLAGLAQLLADLVVGHLQVELVGDRLEDQLARRPTATPRRVSRSFSCSIVWPVSWR